MKRADRLRANRSVSDKYLENIMKSLGLLTVSRDCGVILDIESFLYERGVCIGNFKGVRIEITK